MSGKRRPQGFGRMRELANRGLDALTTPNHRTFYFDGVPIQEMLGIVERAGFGYDPDDGQMILCGREGRATVDLTVGGEPVEHALVFTWHKMDATGRYEIVAYVS